MNMTKNTEQITQDNKKEFEEWWKKNEKTIHPEVRIFKGYFKLVWFASRGLMRGKEKELPHGKRHFSSVYGNS